MSQEAFARTNELLATISTELAQKTEPTDTQTVSSAKSATASVTSVGDSATSVQLLAANASRLGASFYNTSTADLYLKLGATASTSDFTVKLVQGAFYELPPATYTGRIDGIWASDAGGAVVATELT